MHRYGSQYGRFGEELRGRYVPGLGFYGPYGSYSSYDPYLGDAFGRAYESQLELAGFRGFEAGPGSMREQDRVHAWRGGVLGWLGSGLKAAASWTGFQMQRWGSLLGGKLSGGAEEIGESLRGGGERMGTALEESGVRGMRRSRAGEGRPPRLYRRPDERILDDVYERVCRSGADAEEVEIEVNDGVVTLAGSVPSKLDKRLVEELADGVFGVLEVHNHLKLARRIEGRSEEAEARSGEPQPRHNGHESRREGEERDRHQA